MQIVVKQGTKLVLQAYMTSVKAKKCQSLLETCYPAKDGYTITYHNGAAVFRVHGPMLMMGSSIRRSVDQSRARVVSGFVPVAPSVQPAQCC